MIQNILIGVVIFASWTGKCYTRHARQAWSLVSDICCIYGQRFLQNNIRKFSSVETDFRVMLFMPKILIITLWTDFKHVCNILSQLSKTYTMIFKHQLFDLTFVWTISRHWKSIRTRKINYNFSTLFVYFTLFICLCFRHHDSPCLL